MLAFLTGQEEIETACKKVQEASKLVTGGLIALPLYAGLPPSAQMRVFEPTSVPVRFSDHYNLPSNLGSFQLWCDQQIRNRLI